MRPGPVTVTFEPLYALLTPARFPQDAQVAQRQAALRQATDSYLSTGRYDARQEALRSGDRIVLAAVAGAGNLCLKASDGYASASVPARPPAPESLWVVVSAADPASTAELQTTAPVALRNVGRGAYLDAQSGSDETYSVGDGLTAVNATTPKADSAQWTAQLVSAKGRSQLVDGDYVQLLRRWRDADGKVGYLLCDAQANAREQEVFSFGRSGQKGTVWRINRV